MTVIPLPGARCAHVNKDGMLCRRPVWRGNEVFRPTTARGRHRYCIVHLREHIEASLVQYDEPQNR